MDKFILVLQKMPLGVLAFFFLIVFFLISLCLYLYISMNLRRICVIIFNNENRYKLPLEPFNYFFISFLPTTFWRELLNLKKNIKFKNLYKKDFYVEINKNQLIILLKEFPTFFYMQYLIIVCGFLFIIFIILSYCIEL